MPKILPPLVTDHPEQGRGFNAAACMNCGTCTAICPQGLAALPRELFRFALLGLETEVAARAHDVFSCLLCRQCQETCPSQVKIAENIRTLRAYLNEKVFRL